MSQVPKKCACCKTNEPFYEHEKALCRVCFDFITRELSHDDLVAIMTGYHMGHPEDKQFSDIFFYAYGKWRNGL